MPVTTINTVGTVQVKLGGGRLYNITGVSPGTSFAFRALDAPDPNGNSRTLIGAAAIPVVAGQSWIDPLQPICFSSGLQIITSGTAGELFAAWD